MAYYIAYDGGGTKVKAVVFDDEFNLISYKTGGGVNLNFHKKEDVMRHIDASVGEAAREVNGDISAAYGVMVGIDAESERQIRSYMPNAEIKYYGEPHFNLLSALFKLKGVCVLAGTGASFFWLDGEKRSEAMGGFGAHIGDEGSGYYIGENGIRAALQYMNGWGEKTLLTELFQDMVGTEGRRSPFEYFYGEKFRHIPQHMKISGFTRQVEQACKMNDKVAIGIVCRAGECLALQTIALFKKCNIPGNVQTVLSGGAWKTDFRIKRRFTELFSAEYPESEIISPVLEPVAGGIVTHAMKTGALNDRVKNKIIENFKEL